MREYPFYYGKECRGGDHTWSGPFFYSGFPTLKRSAFSLQNKSGIAFYSRFETLIFPRQNFANGIQNFSLFGFSSPPRQPFSGIRRISPYQGTVNRAGRFIFTRKSLCLVFAKSLPQRKENPHPCHKKLWANLTHTRSKLVKTTTTN